MIVYFAYNSMAWEFDHLLGGRPTLEEAVELAKSRLCEYTDARVVEVPVVNGAFDMVNAVVAWRMSGNQWEQLLREKAWATEVAEEAEFAAAEALVVSGMSSARAPRFVRTRGPFLH